MVLSGKGLPLYFAANNGREPLFIYLQTLAVAILGASPYALRLVSALIGILTVPAVYFCTMAFLNSTGSGRIGAGHGPGRGAGWRCSLPPV